MWTHNRLIGLTFKPNTYRCFGLELFLNCLSIIMQSVGEFQSMKIKHPMIIMNQRVFSIEKWSVSAVEHTRCFVFVFESNISWAMRICNLWALWDTLHNTKQSGTCNAMSIPTDRRQMLLLFCHLDISGRFGICGVHLGSRRMSANMRTLRKEHHISCNWQTEMMDLSWPPSEPLRWRLTLGQRDPFEW